MKRVCVFFANGMEECEALITVDILRRAGVNVVTAAVRQEPGVVTSHEIRVEADALASELDLAGFDMVVLPGGLGGTNELAASELVREAAVSFAVQENKLVAAICAAPSVLGGLGLLQGKRATCFPGFEEKLLGAVVTGEPVTEDGNIITGKGMGATIPFALHLVRRLCGADKAEEIRQQIQYPHGV